jgi:hypothetical protein
MWSGAIWLTSCAKFDFEGPPSYFANIHIKPGEYRWARMGVYFDREVVDTVPASPDWLRNVGVVEVGKHT